MYEYVVRKEFVGYLIFDVRKNEITLQDDYSQLKNIKFIDNYYDGYLSAPTQVFAEITDDCQLKCKHCFNGNRRGNAYLETSVWEKIIDRLDECGVFRIRISGGEPFLRKDIIEILKYIDTKSIRYSVYTNGLNVDQYIEELKGLKKLDCIRVSIDGTKEVNDYLRGDGTYDETIMPAAQLLGCALGAGVLPYNPILNNVIPTTYLGTSLGAEPLLGIIAFFSLAIPGCLYCKYFRKKDCAVKTEEEQSMIQNEILLFEKNYAEKNKPNLFQCLIPCIFLLVTIVTLDMKLILQAAENLTDSTSKALIMALAGAVQVE